MMNTILNELVKLNRRSGCIQIHSDVSTVINFEDFNVSIMKSYYGKESIAICDESLEDFDNAIALIDVSKVKKYAVITGDLVDIFTENSMITIECC